ncbi:FtsP/CotA-like multicopper oxidase with cupredoxin domain [Psychrobacillus insolitus]|uniref:FtsP/CotA-like multicopper oxidase with cupredoxin domain n=1 Tax=Psychrobacillus insolitus TaxID=1461 RepID=A0A2W7MQC7_9BACI|nr:multicopper oxidase domain-containing protein [Psychrobacillus insolitus]PZX07374.1 FtsP/CotA-like multicopper oxidase with cupredoxin domain [Psychrobacillus insolitus]
MKSKIWITSFLVSIVILGGCSKNNSDSDNNMEHSNMTQEDMQMEDGTEGDMENSHMSHNDPLTLNDSTGENDLIIPPVLEHEDDEGIVYNIEAQEGSTQFFDGYQTETYGYNGSFLGPVIRVNRGQTVKIRTSNKLSDETTFHWHGLELPGEADGGPHQNLKSGESRIIEFKVDQEASTLWFHPHPEGKTSEQVYKGLAGLIYIDDENSGNLGLPSDYGVNDIPLIIQDKKFDDQKQLNYQEAKNEDGTIGDALLINGTLNPKLTVNNEKVRLRILNGSNARNYTFKLSTGNSFVQIATDGGFLNKPVTLNEIKLTPSERAEIIVDFSGYDSSSDVALINEDETILLPFAINNQLIDSGNIPESLNDFAVTDEERNLPVSKKLELFGMGNMVTINGKQFDMERIDFTQKQGVTEIWEIYNKPDMMGGMIHPFHIHGTQFKIISIDGIEPPENEQGWKDTVAIQPGEKIKLAVKFKNKGIYMFHCHVLEHEDNGMMGQVKVE